ncbi:RING-1 like protein [Moelleriella libera RCEF 2490]|uniref:RING-type E3 ubiquitin transferase n=1 Tax=Moelleriella libera RCEF 2490 TaxID=1081109 RepID=A0A166UPG5_9HYPO|nr:RING-1 like protein [Moelleriella libera RCEF 2490]
MAPPSSPSPSSSSSSPYPFAAAPDIIRAHQKDTYFTSHLASTISDLHRRLFGARSTHRYTPELRSLATLLYFALTTIPGNRTLGEEYCDLVQVDASSASAPHRLPSLRRRSLYVLGAVVLPYVYTRTLPRVRAQLRKLVERRRSSSSSSSSSSKSGASREARLWEYLASSSSPLGPLASSAVVSSYVQAVTLALFYFSGTYYELSKRLLSLRYVFTRNVPDTPDRGGYEVLGVLLVIQLLVQTYLQVRDTASSGSVETSTAETAAVFNTGQPTLLLSDIPTFQQQQQQHNNSDTASAKGDLTSRTHTPVTTGPRFDLAASPKIMAYIKGSQQRKCTLCLEELKDPSATQCGHVFCWECIGDWVREKPECPLCRRDTMVQHILPLRVM